MTNAYLLSIFVTWWFAGWSTIVGRWGYAAFWGAGFIASCIGLVSSAADVEAATLGSEAVFAIVVANLVTLILYRSKDA